MNFHELLEFKSKALNWSLQYSSLYLKIFQTLDKLLVAMIFCVWALKWSAWFRFAGILHIYQNKWNYNCKCKPYFIEPISFSSSLAFFILLFSWVFLYQTSFYLSKESSMKSIRITTKKSSLKLLRHLVRKISEICLHFSLGKNY